jgi:hypothetical protein
MARIFLYISIILVAISCREHFDPPGGAPDHGYLVVEGVINSGTGPTTIRLSRTVPLVDTNALRPESNASVRIEGDNNTFEQLYETGPGVYTNGQLVLNDNVKYRLHIRTNAGREYMTEYAAARKTPPIDNISWERRTDGVELFVNTHDPQDTTRYYHWEYEETWEFNSFYATNLWYVVNPINGNVGVDYSPGAYAQSIYTCWTSEKSSNILIGTSIKLSRDTIHLPITFIVQDAWKLSKLYSINVKQYSPSPGGYEFLQRMKKNTENLGSLFDAQPSQLVGNIRCIDDPNEPVIGYVDVAQMQEKRVFISRSQVAPWNYREACEEISVPNHPDSIRPIFDYMLPTSPAAFDIRGNIIRFFASTKVCVDCNERGTNQKPSYWP